MKLRDMSLELRWVMFAAIVANTSSRMLMPFIPLYLETLGASIAQVGLFFTVRVIADILFRVFGGWISDNVGRIPTMVLGSIFGSIATLALAMATSWEFTLLSAIFSAAGSSMVGPSYQAFIAEESPKNAVGSTFGLMESLFLICQIIGPLFGGFLVENSGYRVLLWTAFVIMICATVVRMGLARGKSIAYKHLNISKLSTDMRKTSAFLLAGGILTWMFISDGLLDASTQAVTPFMPKYLTEIAGITEIGYGGLVAFLSVISVMTFWLGGVFSDRYGEHISISIGAVFSAIAFATLTISTTTISLVLAFGLMGLSGAFIQPAFSALLSRVAPKDQLGVMYGLFQSALGVIAIPAPSIGGTLYDRISPIATLAFGIILSLVAIPLTLVKLRPKNKNKITL